MSAGRESASRSPRPGLRTGVQRCFASNSRRVRSPRGPPIAGLSFGKERGLQIRATRLDTSTTRREQAGGPAAGFEHLWHHGARIDTAALFREVNAGRSRGLSGKQPHLRVSSSTLALPSLGPRGLLARLAPSHGAGPGSIPGGVTARPIRLDWPRTPGFHPENAGSNPASVATIGPGRLEREQRYERSFRRFESSSGLHAGDPWRRTSFISSIETVRFRPPVRARGQTERRRLDMAKTAGSIPASRTESEPRLVPGPASNTG